MNRNLKYVFTLLVAALLITAGVIIYKETNPQWKNYQRAYYQEEAAKVRRALEGAGKTQRESLLKRLGYLSRPDYRIRQILLDGGRRADRFNRGTRAPSAVRSRHTADGSGTARTSTCSRYGSTVAKASQLTPASIEYA